MKKKLLKSLILLVSIISFGVVNAQDIEYTFDGATWEGWTPGGTTGAWASSFENLPNGELTITYVNTSKNAVMYSPEDKRPFNGANYKFIQITVSNESSQINLFRVRGKDATGWFNAVDYTITTDATDEYTTYNIEITHSRWLVASLENWQFIFRKSDGTEITDGATVYVDNILLSDSSTASIDNANAFNFGIYPNPVQDELSISTDEEVVSVQILDLLGNTVLTSSDIEGSLNVSSLTSGVYVIRLTSENGVAISKFVKK